MLGSATGESSQLPIELWAQAPEKKKAQQQQKKKEKGKTKKNVRGWLKKKATLFYCWNNVDTNRPGRKHGRLHSDVKVNIATTTQATDESISSLDQCEGACKEIKCICPLLRNTEHDTEVHPVLQSRSITYPNSAKKKKAYEGRNREAHICVCVCFRQAATAAIIVIVPSSSVKRKKQTVRPLACSFFFFSLFYCFFTRQNVFFDSEVWLCWLSSRERECVFFLPFAEMRSWKKRKQKQTKSKMGREKKKEKHEKRRGLRRGNSCNVQVCKRACSKEGCHAHQPPTHAAGQEKWEEISSRWKKKK